VLVGSCSSVSIAHPSYLPIGENRYRKRTYSRKGIALAFAVAFAFAFLVVIPERGSAFCLRPNSSQTQQTIDSIAFAVAAIFLSPFSAQKTHVKSRNNLNTRNKTRSSWHFS
jgi:hypothetical protein